MLQSPPHPAFSPQSFMAPYYGTQFSMPNWFPPSFVPRAPQAFVANASAPAVPSPSPDFFADSAATHTMSNASQSVQQQVPFVGPDQVIIGNGQGLDIKSIGFTKFRSPLNPKRVLSLNNVLHVPSLTKNLLSVKQFSKDNAVYFQ